MCIFGSGFQIIPVSLLCTTLIAKACSLPIYHRFYESYISIQLIRALHIE